MTVADYADALTLQEARQSYFEANGFPPDGGYDAKWVKLQAGAVVFGIPNTAARVRAVRFHDLHHLITGYDTDWKGEFELSAWEVAGSCRGYVGAWILDIGGLAAGLVTVPRAVFHAFVRGRHSRNFYEQSWSDDILEGTVGDARRQLGLDVPPPAPTIADRAAFGTWSLLAFSYALVSLAVYSAPLVGLVWLVSRLLG